MGPLSRLFRWLMGKKHLRKLDNCACERLGPLQTEVDSHLDCPQQVSEIDCLSEALAALWASLTPSFTITIDFTVLIWETSKADIDGSQVPLGVRNPLA